MKIVKLSREEYRRWRINRLTLCDDETGGFVRYATKAECEKVTQAEKQGVKPRLLTPDGRRLKPGCDRDKIQQEISAREGSCQLRRFNGTIIKTIISQEERARKEAMPKQPVAAPDPERCTCARWDGRIPGKHHRACDFNRMAPMHQRGDVKQECDIKVEEPTAEELAETQLPSPDLDKSHSRSPGNPGPGPQAKQATQVPEPESCVCQEWAMQDGDVEGEHRQICEWYEQWNAINGGLYLYSLDGEKKLRLATPAEQQEAEERLEQLGTSTVLVDGQEYLVQKAS